ncbi:unnamed protein product [Closterium sp. NIES-54]
MGFAGVAFQSRAAAVAELQHCPQFHDAILTLPDAAMFSAPACLLYARSKWFRRAWEDAPGSGFGKCVEITIPPVPGGTEAFESILQYCYGLPVYADATNALQLLCCAAFFEMCEGSEEDSLQRQAWRYINEYVLNEWEDSLRLLETVARDELVMREALKLDLPLHASACVAGTCAIPSTHTRPPVHSIRFPHHPSRPPLPASPPLSRPLPPPPLPSPFLLVGYHLSAMLSGPFDSPTRTAALHHLLARLAALPAPVLSCVLQACRQASVSFVRIGNYLAAHSHSCLFQHIPSLAALASAAAAAAAGGDGDVPTEKEVAAAGAAGAGGGEAASSVGLSSSDGAERRVASRGGGGYKVVCGEEAAEEAEEREEVGRAMLFEYACSEALEHAAAMQALHHRPPAAAGAGGGGMDAESRGSAAALQQQALRRQQQGGLRSSTRYMPSVQYLIVLLKHCVSLQEGHTVTDAHGHEQGGQVGGVGKTRSSASLEVYSLQGKEGPRHPVNSKGVQRASSVQRVGARGVRGGAGAGSTGLRETKSDSDVASSEWAGAGRKGEAMGEGVRAGVGRRKELLFTRLAHRLTAMPTALSLADLVFLGPATSLLLLHSLRDASVSHAVHPSIPPLAPHAGGALPPLPSHPPPASTGTSTSITSSSSSSGRRVAVRVVGSPAAALGGDLVFLIDLIALLNLLFPDARHLPPVPELWSMVDVSALSDEKLALAGKMCCEGEGQGGDAGGDGGERGGGWGGGWGGRGREQGRGWWSEGRVLAQQVEREQRARGVRAEGERGKEGGMRGEVEKERRGRQERALQQAALEVESVRAASTRLALETAQGMASDACPWETLQQRGLDADMVVDIDGVTWPLHRHVLLPHCPLIHSLLPAATAAATASACEGEQGVMPLALGTGLPIVALTGFPGGPRSFSIIVRWCYGSRPKLSPSQAAAVLFAARFLGMEDRGSEALIPVAVRAVKGGLAEGWEACFDILERCYHDRVLGALVVEFSLNRHFVDSAASAILKLESKLVGYGRWGNDDWATVNRLLEGMSKLPPDISRRVVQQLWDLRHSHWATVCPAPCSEAGEEHPGIKAMATVGSFLLGITLLSKMEWRRQQDEEEEEKRRKKGGQGSAGTSSSPSHAANSPSAQALSSSVRSRAQPPYDNILWMLRVLKLFISPPFDRPILLVLSNNTPLLETHHLHFLDLSSCLSLLTLVSAAPRQDSHLVATADLLDVYLATQGTKRNPPLSPEDFRALVTRLPPEARPTHDGVFEAVCAFAEADPRPATWNLLALVDCGRLTPRCLRLAASAAASIEFGQSAVAGFWLFLVSLLRALMYEG